MVHEQITLAHGIEHRAGVVAQNGRCHWSEGGIAKHGEVELREREKVAEVEQRTNLLDVTLREHAAFGRVVTELFEKERAHCLRHPILYFEPNDLTEPALEHLLLDRREQVFRLFSVREV